MQSERPLKLETDSAPQSPFDASTDTLASSRKHRQVASLGQDVHALSYLSGNGYTLTVVLDYKTMKLVAFASNEKSLTLQHGTFELLGSAAR